MSFEVGSALLRRELRGELDAGAAQILATGFNAIPFTREHSPDDLVAAFGLVNNATYADAIYVATAKRLRSPIMTSDFGMAECARIAGVEVMSTREEPGAPRVT